MQVIKDNYATFAVPYNGEDNNDYVDGEVVQHIEYVPFGEVFVEERNNISNHYCPRNSFNISKSNKLIVTHQN